MSIFYRPVHNTDTQGVGVQFPVQAVLSIFGVILKYGIDHCKSRSLSNENISVTGNM